jgi:hypothetical protein
MLSFTKMAFAGNLFILAMGTPHLFFLFFYYIHILPIANYEHPNAFHGRKGKILGLTVKEM